MIVNLLDRLETKQKEFIGVIDYSTKKFIIFYDTSHCHDPSIRMLAILWRVQDTGLRFSMYCKMYYPEIVLPDPVMIPKLGLVDRDAEIVVSYDTPIKPRVKSVRLNQTNRACS